MVYHSSCDKPEEFSALFRFYFFHLRSSKSYNLKMSGPPKERIFFGSLELKEKEIREKPPYNANANSNALRT